MNCCFNILKQIIDYFKENLKITRKVCQEVYQAPAFKKSFYWVFGIYIIGFLSLIQVNGLYKTDVSRVAGVTFQSDWGHAGRWLNDLMVYLFHFSSYPQDISPVSQLVALVFMTIATLILVQVITPRQKESRFVLAVACILGLAPYYLQVFSYTFDCLFYSFAILLAIFPFLAFAHKKNVLPAVSPMCYGSILFVSSVCQFVYDYGDLFVLARVC